MKSAAISCDKLVKCYGDLKAVDELNLEVWAGECFGLLGPNGAGKSTTIEMICGQLPPGSGSIELFGLRWGSGHDRIIRERIGVLLQQTEFVDKLTVEETIKLFLSFYRTGYDIEELIQTVALEEKRRARVSALSGGQKQRLAIACALVNRPEMIFLDEPTMGLDPQARLQLWDLIDRFHRNGGTILLTTHYMEEAARLCDRVAIMDHGKVIALGSPQALVASSDAKDADLILEFSVIGDALRLREECLQELNGVSEARVSESAFFLTVTELSRALPALLTEIDRHDLKLDYLTTHKATLEDIFVSLTGRGLREY